MNLSLIEWDSRNLLLAHLSITTKSVLIGDDIESPSKFLSCRATSNVGYYEVGLISNQPNGAVCCELLPRGNLLIIGYDQAVAVVDLAKGEIPLKEQLHGVFFEFIVDETRNQVLTIHELGVVAISFSGHVQWRCDSPEILEDWQIIDESIQLSTMDDRSMLVNLANGALA